MTARPTPRLLAACALAASAGSALAQADFPAIFVANDGNLEGSVTTLRVEPDGSLTFVDRIVTGSRSSTNQPCPGCNPTAIDLSPNGRFLATAHASGNAAENLTILEVGTDGSLTIVEEFPLAQGGLDVAWISDDLVALPLTDLSITNSVRLFRLDNDNELTQVDAASAGTFLTSMALHPNRRWLYCNDSFNNTVRLFDVDADAGMISLVDTVSIPVFGVALGVDPTGSFLYAAGGISAGGNAFSGLAIDPADGTLAELPGSPFQSPGASPKGFAFAPDGSAVFVSHGTDATIQSFALASDGTPTFADGFDVGTQGTLQGMATLEGLLFAMDETDIIDGIEGAYAFATQPDGSFAPIPGTPVLTQGIAPSDVVAWAGADDPACNPADLAEPFGVLDLADLQSFVTAFLASEPAADLAPPAGVYDLADVQAFITAFNGGCP